MTGDLAVLEKEFAGDLARLDSRVADALSPLEAGQHFNEAKNRV